MSSFVLGRVIVEAATHYPASHFALKTMLKTALLEQLPNTQHDSAELYAEMEKLVKNPKSPFDEMVDEITKLKYIKEGLFIHFDEIGELVKSPSLRLLFEPNTTEDTEVIYAFQATLKLTLKTCKNAFVYASGRGTALSLVGHRSNRSLGHTVHLTMEGLKQEHVEEILKSPGMNELLAGPPLNAQPLCENYFGLDTERDSERIAWLAGIV